MEKFQGSDTFINGNVIMYVHSGFDFWTDLLFCYSMYSECELDLFAISGLFIFLSFLVSLCLIIYWLHRWNTMTISPSYRLNNYLDNYSIFLIFLTIFGDFYSTVSLVQSKLFCLNIFNLPLTQNESQKMFIFKFISITLLEVCL